MKVVNLRILSQPSIDRSVATLLEGRRTACGGEGVCARASLAWPGCCRRSALIAMRRGLLRCKQPVRGAGKDSEVSSRDRTANVTYERGNP
eukprot:5702294-Pleurochrysis_carterae.AAC.3